MFLVHVVFNAWFWLLLIMITFHSIVGRLRSTATEALIVAAVDDLAFLVAAATSLRCRLLFVTNLKRLYFLCRININIKITRLLFHKTSLT